MKLTNLEINNDGDLKNLHKRIDQIIKNS